MQLATRSMTPHGSAGGGIFDGDLIVVDRSLTAVHGSIVIASVNGEPLCKRLTIQGQSVV
ncbi:Error-prone repair protein UmuD [Pseudomonas syringae pv. apii]|uniref:Error-prone repair protein UmuD n=3 Tax=Pseudomonas TaxID=286 RepID=A0A3M5X1F5_9PSED|nr:Error-prone repair protein UmuD [Pseudomonas syringae pv. aceris]RMR51592.1 Error-prone repair protein UmuD [Pseudomonas syringae pv. syringae]RMU75814.1 Error-prone repair protein UmuD [Pseudomonas syringae pv. apii]